MQSPNAWMAHPFFSFALLAGLLGTGLTATTNAQSSSLAAVDVAVVPILSLGIVEEAVEISSGIAGTLTYAFTINARGADLVMEFGSLPRGVVLEVRAVATQGLSIGPQPVESGTRITLVKNLGPSLERDGRIHLSFAGEANAFETPARIGLRSAGITRWAPIVIRGQ